MLIQWKVSREQFVVLSLVKILLIWFLPFLMMTIVRLVFILWLRGNNFLVSISLLWNGMKTDIRRWVDVNLLTLWRPVSSVVLTVNVGLNSLPSFGPLDLVPAKLMPRNLSKMFTTLLQKNSKVNPKQKTRKLKNDFFFEAKSLHCLFIFYCILLYIHCCLRPFFSKIL